jgi:hypothetical protein
MGSFAFHKEGMNRLFLLLVSALFSPVLYAQDSLSLLHALKKGSIHGHARFFSMATDNSGKLSDYAASAIGGGLRYKSAPFHGFSIGLGGYFIYNLASSNLAKPDPVTNASNRYEIGLFDIQDPLNKNDIDRLEELYIQYQHKSLDITLGKQLPEMPFINQQDGRMRATGIDGLQLKWKPKKSTRIQAAYLWQISPRSTVRWFSIGESIGIYPMGQTTDGKPANYLHNLDSKAVLVTGIEQKIRGNLTVQVWNQWVQHIFNAALFQADLRHPISSTTHITAGLQLIRQDAIHHGGNENPANTYFEKAGKSIVWGSSVGIDRSKWNASLNYTRITKDGRYLMPREWGKDPFYTFLQRERNDGYGDLDAVTIKFNYIPTTINSRFFVGYGHYYLPAIDDARFNKYSMPAYRQLNLSWKYEFQQLLKGMDIQFLYVHKAVMGSNRYSPKQLINKVNMSNYNLILNYSF